MKMGKALIFKIVFLTFCFMIKNAFCSEVNITSDKMEVIESEGIAVFTGKVHAKRKDLEVFCDKMYVYYITQNGKKNITRIIALGKVIINKGKWKAYSGKATYFKDQEKLVLEDNPKVWHEKNLVEGDVVIIYFNEDRSEVLSRYEGRVRATIYLQ